MTLISKFVLFIIAAVILSSCGVHNVPAMEASLHDAGEFERRSFDNSGFAAFLHTNVSPEHAMPGAAWTASDLSWAALYFRSDAKAAYSLYREAQAAEITAGQSPNPTVSVTPQRDTTVNPFETLLGLGLSWTIETNGKKQLRIEQAEANSRAVLSQYETSVWNTRRDVVAAALNFKAAQETAFANREMTDQQQKLIAAFNEQKLSGQTLSSNLHQLEIAYHQSLLASQIADRALVDAENALAAAVGVPLTALQGKNVKPLAPKQKITAAFRENAIRNHPDIKAALAAYEAAHKAFELEIAKRIPDIDLGPGYEWNSAGGGKYSLGLTLILPLMNDNEGPVAETKAKRETAVHNFNIAQDKVLSAIDQAEASYKAARIAYRKAREVSAAENEKIKDASEAIKNPLLAKLPLLTLQAEKSSLLIPEIDAKYQELRAYAALEDAYRQPFLSDDFDPPPLFAQERGIR